MDKTTLLSNLISNFAQFNLTQKKIFLDWVEFLIENDENDEKSRNLFFDSLLNNYNDFNREVELDEAKINERLNLLIKKIEEGSDWMNTMMYRQSTENFVDKSFQAPNLASVTPSPPPPEVIKEFCKAICRVKFLYRNQNKQYLECVRNCEQS